MFTKERSYAEYKIRFMSQLEDQIMKGLRPSMRMEVIPTKMIDLIQRCWDDNPERRPTMDEIVEELYFEFKLPFPPSMKLRPPRPKMIRTLTPMIPTSLVSATNIPTVTPPSPAPVRHAT